MRYVCLMMLLALLFVVWHRVAGRRRSCSFTRCSRRNTWTIIRTRSIVAEVNKGTNRCFVCHQGKKSRKNHNAFGKPLVELLDRKKDIKDNEKIAAAIKKVVAMHVDPKDEKSETYLDRIKASKWPGGEFEDLQKEPAEQTAGKVEAG